MITHESITLNASEPGFIIVHYVQLDDGIDMGGRFCFERESLPVVAELLGASLKDYYFMETERRCGDDHFRFYVSGSDQQTFYNVINRRSETAAHGGLYGLMLTVEAGKDLLARLAIQSSER